MKHKKQMVSTIILLFLGIAIAHAQQTIPAVGGNATGSSGSVSYTVGQVSYTTAIGTGGSVTQGVQIPYEIIVVTSVNVDNKVNLNYSIYPNPTSDFLTLKIESESASKYSVSLFDLKGKLLEYIKIDGRETKIEMQHYPPAIYFLKVSGKNKEVKTFKIIKN